MRADGADRGDRGDIVLGWLARLTLTLGVVGLIGFDAIALAMGHLQTEDRASSAARAAVSSYRSAPDAQRAYEAALHRLAEADSTDSIDPASFSVTPDGSVTLTVEHTAPTFLVEKIGPIRDWATASATVTSTPGG